MDSTPPPPPLRSNPHSNTKSASRLSRIAFSVENKEPSNLSLDLSSASPTNTPSPASLRSSNGLPLRELLLLSSSPRRKSRTRLSDRIEMVEDGVEPTSATRRRCKNRGAQMGLMGCASPRNSRRSRRRSEMEMKEDRDPGLVEEIGKARKRRNSGRSKKEKLSLVPLVPSPSPSPKNDDGDTGNFDRIGMVVADLIMWKDVAKSGLFFGLVLGVFVSCLLVLHKESTLGIFSAISQLGLLFLGASFFSNSIRQRNNGETKSEFKLKEEDVLRLGRLILPATNLAISKIRNLFSGEPYMTLRITPFLLLGAEYGHLITLWRLCALGFFISFTVPRLYYCYCRQINQKVENVKRRVIEAWRACSHKKIVVASAATAFWNLSSIKTRIFTGFISLVILQYCRQHLVAKSEEKEAEEEHLQQALVVGEGQEQQALVVAEAEAGASQK